MSATRPRPVTWTAADAERWLLGLELFGMRFGLDRMRRLMTALQMPNEAFHAIHVVGTNGKSSTARMIAALLQRHGLRAGAYLSPHLVSFAERILVGGRELSDDELAAALLRARRVTELVDRTLGEGDRVTQFEALTAAAYTQLAAARVDVAVVEAGLGGRWDATNVLDAQVAVLTNVGLEHARWLGPTVADIAREKLAVLAPGATLVLGPDLHREAEQEAQLAAQRQGAEIVRAPSQPRLIAADFELLTRGDFQRRNFSVACAAADALLARLASGSCSLPSRGSVPGALREETARAAAASTRVPGRFEIVQRGDGVGEVVLDAAHNPAAVAALADTLRGHLAGRRLVAVVSVLDDKDAASMLAELLALCAAAVFTTSANPRALSPATLASLAGQLGAPAATRVERDPRRALAVARELAGADGVVLATGSIYLIADLTRPACAGRGSTL